MNARTTTPIATMPDWATARQLLYLGAASSLGYLTPASLADWTVDLTRDQCPVCGADTDAPGQICTRCADPFSPKRGPCARGPRKGERRKVPPARTLMAGNGYGKCETCGRHFADPGAERGHTSTEFHKVATWIRYQIKAGRRVVRGQMARTLRMAVAAQYVGTSERWLPHPAFALALPVPESLHGIWNDSDRELLAIADPIYRTLRETLWSDFAPHVACVVVNTGDSGMDESRRRTAFNQASLLRFVTTLRLTYTRAPLDYGCAYWSPPPSTCEKDTTAMRSNVAAVVGQAYMDCARRVWVEGEEAVLP